MKPDGLRQTHISNHKEVRMECGVCYEEVANLVKCGGCGHGACRPCVERYLMGLMDPRCMSCGCGWDLLFLRKHLDLSFLDGPWREHRKKLLSKRCATGVVCPSCPEGRVFGSVCGACRAKVCPECSCLEDGDHRCREEVVASLGKIRETTRKCPGCHAPIEKASGCFQMFCTQCHTAFDWKNGSVLEKKRIHNPHYYNHQRDAEELLRLVCGKKQFYDFYRLVMEVGRQASVPAPPPPPPTATMETLYKHDEEQRRWQCLRALWSRHYRKGLSLLREVLPGGWERARPRLREYAHDLRDDLIDYNEHIGGCLLLRGNRLFPCQSSALVCS